MEALSSEQLQQIANRRGLSYNAPPDETSPGRRIVRTTLTRDIALPRDTAFNTFADPQAHVRFFSIIKNSTPLIPLEGPLQAGEFIVLEHVQEANLPPRMMVVKYTLQPPDTIIKEAVTDPFRDNDIVADKKKARVVLRFEPVDQNTTRVTTESAFETNDGPVFVRGFIDHVWLNFYEKLLVETGEISADEMLTAE